MRGILLIAHGSREKKANDEVAQLAESLKPLFPDDQIAYAFLQVADPPAAEELTRLIRKGVREVVILPHFLNAGKHLQKDIPALVKQAEIQYPDIPFRVMPHLGAHDDLKELYASFLNTK